MAWYLVNPRDNVTFTLIIIIIIIIIKPTSTDVKERK